MTVLVTGGLGFIGHNVVAQLEAVGQDIVVVDNQTNHSLSTVRQYQHIMHNRRQRIRSPIYHTDITDHEGMITVFKDVRPRVVVHLASVARQAQAQQDPQRAAQVMIQGLVNCLELSCQYNVERFVFVSSSMVYGDFVDNVTESALCQPRGQYGVLKLAGEWLVKDYAERHGFEYVILRPSAVYGEHDTLDRVMAKFILSAMQDQPVIVHGAQERLDFTHVADTAAGVVQATLGHYSLNKTYNITRGHARTLLEAANLVCATVGRGSIEVRDRDHMFPRRGTLDISAAKRDFGFDPVIDLEQGIQQYCHWLKDSLSNLQPWHDKF